MIYTYGNAATKAFFDVAASGQVTSIGALRNYDNSVIHFFYGTIDDVRIYDRALTALEVQLLYQDTLD